ncbi:hypothetical protein ZIOFF_076175 [Zingiber officinale]|uniref:Uncharacterized protein n=1 Tax=Zingiber officinale TaxID=94328 RepID=A0A8J5BS17_ZINOF|nr:hypothetical protein ZIOFF_076175 [Zingiber officinale]
MNLVTHPVEWRLLASWKLKKHAIRFLLQRLLPQVLFHTNMLDSQVQVSWAHNYPAPATNLKLHDVTTDACAAPKSGLQFNSLERLTEEGLLKT